MPSSAPLSSNNNYNLICVSRSFLNVSKTIYGFLIYTHTPGHVYVQVKYTFFCICCDYKLNYIIAVFLFSSKKDLNVQRYNKSMRRASLICWLTLFEKCFFSIKTLACLLFSSHQTGSKYLSNRNAFSSATIFFHNHFAKLKHNRQNQFRTFKYNG